MQGHAASAAARRERSARIAATWAEMSLRSDSATARCVVDSTQIAKHRGAKVISLTSAGKNPLSKLADISLNTNSKETKYRVVSIASRVAALTIADSIYTYIAMRTDGAKSLQIEKSMESLKY